MGVECICFSYIVGVLPLAFGIYVLNVGKVYLTSWSEEPLRGNRARLVGFSLIMASVLYYGVILWAWSCYDR
jgi:hypothetical protein